MSLAPTTTLGDATTDVLERLGFSELGTARTRAVSRAEAFIRQAVNELVHEAEWSSMIAEMRIPLIEGQGRYEYPGEVGPGDLGDPLIERDDGTAYPLVAGLRPHDRGDAGIDEDFGRATGAPDRYRLIDGEIEIYPAPKPIETYVSLLLTYKKSVPALRDPSEILPFDTEVIVQRAVILGRIHYQKPGVDDAERAFQKYLARIKAKQGVRRDFIIGGRKSHFITRDKRVPRTGGDVGSVGSGAPSGPNWHPW